ncbi:MAG: RidA family protein [Actinomycetes bacterium]|jgi:enamine deaminase RidA (YjgF/YER057c/UK114 family)
MTRDVRNISEYHVPVGGFTQFVVSDPGSKMVFISGLTARQADGSVGCVGDIVGQTSLVLESMKKMLESAGGSLDDVVRIVTYLTDINDHHKMHEVRREFFGDNPPASTSVQVVRLYHPDQLVEIEATAILK